MKKILCLLPLFAFADGPIVGDVTAAQDSNTRLVKVSYTLTGGPAVVTFDVQLSGKSIGDAHTATYAGEVRKLLQPSETPYTFTWDPRKDWPDQNIEDDSLEIVVNAWDPSSPPDYMVVYPGNGNISYFTSAENLPQGGLANDIYRDSCIVMRKIPAGWFMMGSASSEPGRTAKREVLHKVNISQDFYIGVFEVTQGQWKRETGSYRKQNGGTDFIAACTGDTLPAHSMNLSEIGYAGLTGDIADGTYLAQIRTRTGVDFVLPTEAQWEYACKAGTESGQWNDGSKILGTAEDQNVDKLALYQQNSYTSLSPVGSKKSNAWGLYDMHGSVAEFCRDLYVEAMSAEEVTDPGTEIIPSGGQRNIRGGSFRQAWDALRSAQRTGEKAPNGSWWTNGFRLCCPAVAK